MGFQLRTGISFCEVSDRLLFLDTVADRYFCLRPGAEHAFRNLVADRRMDDAGRQELDGMIQTGALVASEEHGAPLPFRASRQVSTSLLDAEDQKTSLLSCLSAMTAVTLARLSLQPGRLHRILRSLDLAKVPWPRSGRVDLDDIQATVSAFESSNRFMRSHDQCLPRSLAMARYLAARNLPAELIIGVKLRPFAAHAWVQAGPWLLNDRIDTIRAFTPILAV